VQSGDLISCSHDAVIRVFDDAGKVIETHEQPPNSGRRGRWGYATALDAPIRSAMEVALKAIQLSHK